MAQIEQSQLTDISGNLILAGKPGNTTYVKFYCYTKEAIDFTQATLVRDVETNYLIVKSENYNVYLSIDLAHSEFIKENGLYESIKNDDSIENRYFYFNTISLNSHTQRIEPLKCSSEISTKLGIMYISSTEKFSEDSYILLDEYVEYGTDITVDRDTLNSKTISIHLRQPVATKDVRYVYSIEGTYFPGKGVKEFKINEQLSEYKEPPLLFDIRFGVSMTSGNAKYYSNTMLTEDLTLSITNLFINVKSDTNDPPKSYKTTETNTLYTNTQEELLAMSFLGNTNLLFVSVNDDNSIIYSEPNYDSDSHDYTLYIVKLISKEGYYNYGECFLKSTVEGFSNLSIGNIEFNDYYGEKLWIISTNSNLLIEGEIILTLKINNITNQESSEIKTMCINFSEEDLLKPTTSLFSNNPFWEYSSDWNSYYFNSGENYNFSEGIVCYPVDKLFIVNVTDLNGAEIDGSFLIFKLNHNSQLYYNNTVDSNEEFYFSSYKPYDNAPNEHKMAILSRFNLSYDANLYNYFIGQIIFKPYEPLENVENLNLNVMLLGYVEQNSEYPTQDGSVETVTQLFKYASSKYNCKYLYETGINLKISAKHHSRYKLERTKYTDVESVNLVPLINKKSQIESYGITIDSDGNGKFKNIRGICLEDRAGTNTLLHTKLNSNTAVSKTAKNEGDMDYYEYSDDTSVPSNVSFVANYLYKTGKDNLAKNTINANGTSINVEGVQSNVQDKYISIGLVAGGNVYVGSRWDKTGKESANMVIGFLTSLYKLDTKTSGDAYTINNYAYLNNHYNLFNKDIAITVYPRQGNSSNSLINIRGYSFDSYYESIKNAIGIDSFEQENQYDKFKLTELNFNLTPIIKNCPITLKFDYNIPDIQVSKDPPKEQVKFTRIDGADFTYEPLSSDSFDGNTLYVIDNQSRMSKLNDYKIIPDYSNTTWEVKDDIITSKSSTSSTLDVSRLKECMNYSNGEISFNYTNPSNTSTYNLLFTQRRNWVGKKINIHLTNLKTDDNFFKPK